MLLKRKANPIDIKSEGDADSPKNKDKAYTNRKIETINLDTYIPHPYRFCLILGMWGARFLFFFFCHGCFVSLSANGVAWAMGSSRFHLNQIDSYH